jgi:hypothetical protein
VFLGLQSRQLVGLGHGGGHDLQDVAAQATQLDGPEVPRLGHQMRLGLPKQFRVEVGGEVVETPDQHPGLFPGHPPRRDRIGEVVPPVPQRRPETFLGDRLPG